VVEAMARDAACTPADLMRDPELRKRIDPSRYVTAEVGLPTLHDILAELARPGRDPREEFEPFSFAPGIEKVEDLVPGMRLPGIVTNVTAFGAFVDIGVHRDGLVHVSELSDHFVKDPGQVVRVHQRVTVRVLEVDRERNRIGLSMKTLTAPGTERNRLEEKAAAPVKSGKAPRAPGKSSFNNPFEAVFKKS
jgi:protein Tex